MENGIRKFELPNVGDGRKEFYGKAHQIEHDNGTIELQSYDTIVGRIKDGKCEIFGTYSATTLRHIRSWLLFNGFKSGSKQEIIEMYCK